MKRTFEIVQPWLLAHEGGYVNHPKDPGGATNQGITQRTYNAHRARLGQKPASVKYITSPEVDTIYRTQYWDKCQADDLPLGLDYAVYDFAVNSGVSRSVRTLQKIVGTEPDGVLGVITLQAISKMAVDNLIVKLCEARMRFLKRLKHWSTFKTGWTRRVMGKDDGAQVMDIGVIDRGVQLAREVAAANIPAPVQPSFDDGAGAKGTGGASISGSLLATFGDKAGLGTISTTAALSAVPAVINGNGPIQWAIAAGVVMAVCVGVWWLVTRDK